MGVELIAVSEAARHRSKTSSRRDRDGRILLNNDHHHARITVTISLTMFTTQMPALWFATGSLPAALKIRSYEQNSFPRGTHNGGVPKCVCTLDLGPPACQRSAFDRLSYPRFNIYDKTLASAIRRLNGITHRSDPHMPTQCPLCQFEGPVYVSDRSAPTSRPPWWRLSRSVVPTKALLISITATVPPDPGPLPS